MKRRNFIKSAVVAGIGAGHIRMLSGDGHEAFYPQQKFEPTVKSLLDTLENNLLHVSLFTDGSAIINDKENNVAWNMGPVAIQDDGMIDETRVWMRAERTLMEQYPGRFKVEKLSDEVYNYILLGRQNRRKGSFKVQISLQAEWLKFKLLEISEDLPSLIFPPPIESEKVVVPYHAGSLIHKPKPDIWTRKVLPFFTHLNMRWIGGLSNNYAWIAIFGDKVVDAAGFLANNSVCPVWLKSLNRWGDNYSVQYKFIKGGYVDLAKTYRNYLIKRKQFVSLAEKAEKNPQLRNMLGGRTLTYFQAWPPLIKEQARDYLYNNHHIKQANTKDVQVDFTYNDVQKSLQYAQKKGFKNGLVMLRGWINRGYDASHPDIWPPEPGLGSLDEFNNLLTSFDKTLFGLHDNYQDMYETSASFPGGINMRPNGDFVAGGLWAGGQAYILNSRNSVYYAKRNAALMQQLKYHAAFVDTATASKLQQSFEAGNELTRLQDLELKLDLLQVFVSKGKLVGSEEGNEFGAMVCEWNETRHERHAGETIPLWQLVFHDSLFASRYTSFAPGSSYPKWLEDMLWGNQLQFFMTQEFGGIKPAGSKENIGFGANLMNEEIFTSTYHVDKWHAQTGMDEMTSHAFLNDEASVEETSFSSGKKIMVNFSNEEQSVKGIAVPSRSFKIIE